MINETLVSLTLNLALVVGIGALLLGALAGLALILSAIDDLIGVSSKIGIYLENRRSKKFTDHCALQYLTRRVEELEKSSNNTNKRNESKKGK